MKIDSRHLDSAINYDQYLEEFEGFVEQGQSSGPDQKVAFIEYTKLNWQRSKRIAKQARINEELVQSLSLLNEPHTILAITETWCGDAAQNLPWLKKVADASAFLEMKVIYRDNSTELIQDYLTSGTRSIPKVLLVRESNLKVCWVWGPRPSPLQSLVVEAKNNPNTDWPELKKEIQLWYNKDKGKTLMEEISALFANLCETDVPLQNEAAR